MEERKVVDELVDAVALFVSKEPVAADKSALFKGLKSIGYDSCIRDADRFCHFAPGHAHFLCGECACYFDVQWRIPEKRRVELRKFSLEWSAVGEEQKVEVLREAVSLDELPPVIRDAT